MIKFHVHFCIFLFALEMSKESTNKTYLFVDETGDPVVYGNRTKLLAGTEGFQPFPIIGMIERKIGKHCVKLF